MESIIPSFQTLRDDYVIYTTTITAVASWLLLHRLLVNRGFVFRRRGLSSDTRAALSIGISCTLWTAAVFRRVLLVEDTSGSASEAASGRATVIATLAELARAPLLVQTLFTFWLLAWIDGVVADRRGGRPRLVSLTGLHGIHDWESGLNTTFYRVLCAVVVVAVSVPSACAVVTGDAATGVLNTAGLVAFLLDGVPKHGYFSATHRYAEDSLRIVLPTTHHEGTTYVLPSHGRGFDATWSAKIAAEHVEADGEMMVLFARMRAGEWEPSEVLRRLRNTMACYREMVVGMSVEQAERLARWIYADGGGDERARGIECVRVQGVHLVGRDLMFSLCVAEYLVFMSQGILGPEMKAQVGKLRLMRRSGAGDGEQREAGDTTIGFSSGIQGYRRAVEHVYDVFDIPIEREAIEFSVQPPARSFALKKSPGSMEEYVGELWDLATEHSESTFSALYFFTVVWFMEMGNVNGFHIFPLRVRTRDGDLGSRMVVWRQAWFAACIGQLVSVSWIGFAGFVFGFFP